MSPHKIKVLHVVGKMHPGGIETLLMNVYRQTDREKFEFHFAVQTEEKAFYDDEIEALGGTIIRQPHPQRGMRKFKKALEANMRKNGPYAAVHSHIFGFSGYVLKIADGLGVPVRISHSHTVHSHRNKSLVRRIYTLYMQQLIRNHATKMLGCSRDACESLYGKKCWGDDRVHVFPNAISLEPYESLPADRGMLRVKLGLGGGNDPLFVHIGRFVQQKNHSFLIDRFAEYVEANPRAKLLLVGDGPQRPEIEAKVQRLGLSQRIEFLGLRKDIPELLGAADGFILPSLFEGLGIVLIEAQAAGIPCLVSEGVPEEADMQLGLFHKLQLSDDPNLWLKGLQQLLGTSPPDWSSRREALEQFGFNMASSVRRLEHLYGG
ncbi:putative glycosyltransferase EpsF [Paenibacillus baekrokdamisoli]|uniref:Putative glycosyltransferase EpsF n=1 Tax=Paenibacillus baekrokdamisoli TaxID=1712516 RepID=A0A3G9J8G2_9BACL|nr:glycosyltransferase family 1 protein [Paenibacillus baekrokdamisoli]MBB3067247.1 glycosyltransferase involved in cell wall biosynthesis [Paenibacillus baekrokdamisoli]BBH19564.1 putative glycosyltransferase EpsF [Paenibacillus baekrokdamisoli]